MAHSPEAIQLAARTKPVSQQHSKSSAIASDPPQAAAQIDLQQRPFETDTAETEQLPSDIRSSTPAPPTPPPNAPTSHNFSHIGIQAKLTVGAPDDVYEQEADRVAAQVMRMPDPGLRQSVQARREDDWIQTPSPLMSAVQRQDDGLTSAPSEVPTISPIVQRQAEEDDSLQLLPQLQQRAIAAPTDASANLESRLAAQSGGGTPLAPETRAFMEPRFGFDFSQVRIHTDSNAVQMSQDLGAQAFTHGHDIYFGAGKYDPNSGAGKELLAHELTHVVQQTGRVYAKASNSADALITTSNLSPAIQRDCNPSNTSCLPANVTTSSSTSSVATAGLSPEAARQLLYARTTLQHVEPLAQGDRTTLERAVPGAQILAFIQERDEKRARLNQKTEELQRYQRDIANPPEHGVPPNQEMVTSLTNEIDTLRTDVERLNQLIQAALPTLNVSSEQELTRLVTEDFPRMFVERGKRIALTELDQNKTIVEQEIQRYGLNACVDPAQRQGLTRAAQDLVNRDQEIDRLQQHIQMIRSSVVPPPAGVPDAESMGSSYYDYQRLPQQQERLQQLQQERTQRQQGYGLQYPILMQQNLDLQAIASGNEERINGAVGGRLQEILSNIEETRTNINSGRLKIWNLRNIVEMTNQDLGIGSNQLLQTAVNNHIQREQSDERALQIGLAALAITAGLIATFATGGLALAAGAVAIGVGTYQVSQSVQNYMAESAASNIALDPTIADISHNEPELFWLVLDIAGVVFDVAQVVRAVNQLRNAARALRQGGNITEFAQAARAALPATAAERVIASATRQAGVSASVTRTIEAVGTTFRRAHMEAVAQHIEQIAGRGFRRVIERLQADGSFHPLTEEALETVLGNRRAAQLITEERALTWRGFYDPRTGHMFIRPGTLEDFSSTVIHESVHYVQASFGESVRGFLSEFEAYSAQRHFLQKLAMQSGESTVPDAWRWLRNATDNDIALHLSQPPYNYTIPGNIDSFQTVLDVIRRMNRF
jgi:hypothetical protein